MLIVATGARIKAGDKFYGPGDQVPEGSGGVPKEQVAEYVASGVLIEPKPAAGKPAGK